MMTVAPKGLWISRVPLVADDSLIGGSHPGIFGATKGRRVPQVHQTSSSSSLSSVPTNGPSSKARRHQTWAPETGDPRATTCTTPRAALVKAASQPLLTPIKSADRTGRPLDQLLEAFGSPTPTSGPSTDPGSSSPEGSVRVVSTPESSSADESGSCSPPLSVKTPPSSGEELGSPTAETESSGDEQRNGGGLTPWSARTAASITEKTLKQGGMWSARLSGSESTDERRLRHQPPISARMSDLGSPVPFCQFLRTGETFTPRQDIDSCVSAARAAAATAKGLTGALSTELRDLESEMADLTRELLAIRAAVPEAYCGKLGGSSSSSSFAIGAAVPEPYAGMPGGISSSMDKTDLDRHGTVA